MRGGDIRERGTSLQDLETGTGKISTRYIAGRTSFVRRDVAIGSVTCNENECQRVGERGRVSRQTADELPLGEVLREWVLPRGYQGDIPRTKADLRRVALERERSLRESRPRWVNSERQHRGTTQGTSVGLRDFKALVGKCSRDELEREEDPLSRNSGGRRPTGRRVGPGFFQDARDDGAIIRRGEISCYH